MFPVNHSILFQIDWTNVINPAFKNNLSLRGQNCSWAMVETSKVLLVLAHRERIRRHVAMHPWAQGGGGVHATRY